ncbi:hypothetical protein QBC43DRAFT_339043 [Cladorrhinum sp. PSN259]|nr:hypothetical protein QBC43DRAFT_339043 [Cladorrhinum sp. PSN259]
MVWKLASFYPRRQHYKYWLKAGDEFDWQPVVAPWFWQETMPAIFSRLQLSQLSKFLGLHRNSIRFNNLLPSLQRLSRAAYIHFNIIFTHAKRTSSPATKTLLQEPDSCIKITMLEMDNTTVAALIIVVLAFCITMVAVVYAVAINRRGRSATTMMTMSQMEAARFHEHLRRHDHDHYYHTNFPLRDLSRTDVATQDSNSINARRQRRDRNVMAAGSDISYSPNKQQQQQQPPAYSPPQHSGYSVTAPRPVRSFASSAQAAASRSTLDIIPEARSSMAVDTTQTSIPSIGSSSSSSSSSSNAHSSSSGVDEVTIVIRTQVVDENAKGGGGSGNDNVRYHVGVKDTKMDKIVLEKNMS